MSICTLKISWWRQFFKWLIIILHWHCKHCEKWQKSHDMVSCYIHNTFLVLALQIVKNKNYYNSQMRSLCYILLWDSIKNKFFCVFWMLCFFKRSLWCLCYILNSSKLLNFLIWNQTGTISILAEFEVLLCDKSIHYINLTKGFV